MVDLNDWRSKIFISTLRDAPNDAVVVSHQLMMRAWLLRKLWNWLYSYMPMWLRSFRKVENIIREELDAAWMFELKIPVIQPAEIWKESWRWAKMWDEMLKAKNRGWQEMVVSPTAEEWVTALVRENLTSYKQLPFTLYQINTKYRDEIRPRYGVMRGREFTMMDAYSFDKDQNDLDVSYEKAAVAYHRIFKRMWLNIIPVKADTWAMWWSGSEEFMVESEIWDDTLILCPKCKYAANDEKATCKADLPLDKDGNVQKETSESVQEIDTPDVKTIEELSDFLKTTPQSFIKTLIYHVENPWIELPEDFVAVCIRGDLDVNEAKLCALLKASSVELAAESDVVRITWAPVWFAWPVKLWNTFVIADNSVMDMHDAVTWWLKKDVHFVHVEPNRDFTPSLIADVRLVVPWDRCPECGEVLYSKKWNELWHIFKLWDKYTKSMNLSYLDENGKSVTPIMWCYGIWVDRTLASIIEEHHDENGIVWPMSVAPYQVVIVPVMYKDNMKEVSDKIYSELRKAGIDVLLDSRDERPWVKFKDADLIWYPIRIVVWDKNLPNVELKLRTSADFELVSSDEISQKVIWIVNEELEKLR